MTDIVGLKGKYIELYGVEGCSTKELAKIEDALNVQLSHDFKKISEFYSGGFFGGISHHEIAIRGEAANIVQETLRIREAAGLNNEFIVLAEPSGSIIVLDVRGKSSVIWCDAVEVDCLNTMEFITKPDIRESYASFFLHLLNQEDQG